MALKDLKLPTVVGERSEPNGGRDRMSRTKAQVDNDYEIACNLIDVLFRHVNDSLQRDRSRVEVNIFMKSFIKTSLGRTVIATKDYVNGMYPQDIELLINDMEKEIKKRNNNRK